MEFLEEKRGRRNVVRKEYVFGIKGEVEERDHLSGVVS